VDDIFRVAIFVQQIITGLNGAVSEEGNTVVITTIYLKITKHNGR